VIFIKIGLREGGSLSLKYMILDNKVYEETLVGSVFRKKFRIFIRIIVYIQSLIASSGFTHSKEMDVNIKILMLESSRYLDDGADDKLLKSACLQWQLSTDDINKIFKISEKFSSHQRIVRDFYWLPCEISGKLIANGIEWSFIINSAATAVWENDNDVIYWGCSNVECESFFLLPYDGMCGF